jgi:hypothetical protein
MQRMNTWAARIGELVSPRRDAGNSNPPSALESVPPDSMSGQPPLGGSRHYGPHDPVLDAPRFLWACVCGRQPALHLASGPDSLAGHAVRCAGCGRSGRPRSAAWQAVTDWNRATPDVELSLERFPFFELEGLTAREARIKLLGIRTDLETRRLQVAQRQQERREVSKRYRERIDAYLHWTIVAQALGLAHSRRHGQGVPALATANSLRTRGADRPPGPSSEAASLNSSMLAVLRRASEGTSLYADCVGRSEQAARLQTVRALVRMGLLHGTDESITTAGLDALK